MSLSNTEKPENKSKRSSSHGDSPVEMTPKDITPADASWRDRTKRNIASDDDDEREDALLDEAVELTFPASDPIAVKSITKVTPVQTQPDKEKSKDGAPKPKDQ